MARLIRITCRQPGFRRAGLAHPARAEYPAETFSAAQIALLRAEPLLDVQEIEAPGDPGGAADAPAAASAGKKKPKGD